MKLGEALQTPTTKVPPSRTYSEVKIGEALERNGWMKAVAGKEDFDRATRAIKLMLETNRGLLLSGEAGSGKTHLARALKNILHLDCMSWYYCKDKDHMDELRVSFDDAIKSDVILDDIGSEDVRVEYGNRIDIVGDFIQLYHARSLRRFIGTTNLSSEGMMNRYGGRVVDRLGEMCVTFRLKGESKRERIVIR